MLSGEAGEAAAALLVAGDDLGYFQTLIVLFVIDRFWLVGTTMPEHMDPTTDAEDEEADLRDKTMMGTDYLYFKAWYWKGIHTWTFFFSSWSSYAQNKSSVATQSSGIWGQTDATYVKRKMWLCC